MASVRVGNIFDIRMFLKVSKILGLLLCSISLLLGLVYTYPVFFIRSWTDTVHGLWVSYGLWASLHQWLSPSVLFLLVNLVVGTLVIASGFVQLRKKRSVLSKDENVQVPGEDEWPSDSADEVSLVSSLPHVHEHSVSSNDLLEGKASSSVFCLVRSKSEQIPTSKNRSSLPLDKYRTSNVIKKASLRPPNDKIVNNSPEEEVQLGGQEVDKKAEAFIGKFYQQIKLQKLESLLRYKDMIYRSQG